MAAALEPPARESALEGLRVVLLGSGVAPAFAGRWLATFGAAVIALETPDGAWRRHYAPSGETATSADGPLAAFLDVGVTTVPLGDAGPTDRAALQALLADANILVHDLAPEALARWGLSAESLRAEFPALVQVALTPFGSTGPYAFYAATSITLLALGGYQFLSGEPGREPLMLPGFQPEYLTGFYGVIAALAAQFRATERGQGCAAEVASMDALASLHQFTTSQWLYGQSIRTRHGNRWENLYPITMLPCRDGYVALSTPSQEMWERLCAMISRPDLLDDPRFATMPARHQNADVLDAVLIAWLRGHTMDELFRIAQEQWRIPLNPYAELDEVLRDPQYLARGFWVRAENDDSGVIQTGLPVIMSRTPWRMRRETADSAASSRHAAGQDNAPAFAPPDEAPTRARWARSTEPSRQRPTRARAAGTVPTADVKSADPRTPLAGLRVLDFTRVWSGPLCTRILADLGAEVIRIDTPFARIALPQPDARPVAGPGKLGRNKLSVSIDLRLPPGRELVKRLVSRSDLLIENFSARVMPNFGLDYAALRAVNPGLIMLSMSGYGATGPYRDYLCYGSATESMTGMTALMGYPGEEPLNSAIAYPDAVAGLSGAASVLTALLHRQRTGEGQFLDLSQIEPATLMWGEYFLEYQMTGKPPGRTGNQHPSWSPHGAYRCCGEDEWLSLAVRSDEEWQRFRVVTGLPEDPAFATAAGRREQRARLDLLVSGWTADQEKFQAMARLQEAGIPAGAVLNARELVESPQLAARGFFVDATAPEGGSFPMPGTPLQFDGQRREEWQAAPKLGEHNRDVLTRVLGMMEAEIDALVRENVIAGGTR